MRSVGIRELRQQASRHLRAVQAGRTLQITDRGRPVALLVPLPDDSTAAALEASGRLVRGSGDPLELGEPLPPKRGVPPPSAILETLRRDER